MSVLRKLNMALLSYRLYRGQFPIYSVVDTDRKLRFARTQPVVMVFGDEIKCAGSSCAEDQPKRRDPVRDTFNLNASAM